MRNLCGLFDKKRQTMAPASPPCEAETPSVEAPSQPCEAMGAVAGGRLEALYRLLASAFDEWELRRFLGFGPGGDDLLNALPGWGASMDRLAFVAVAALERRAMLDAALFDRLLALRPKRRAEIEAIRALFGEA